ncbi:hypothetical protein FACS1894187_21560 [Synergistales bacterium]|nr:hypothetical protein FACS1894187_21560 [Synergistales bacterium]
MTLSMTKEVYALLKKEWRLIAILLTMIYGFSLVEKSIDRLNYNINDNLSDIAKELGKR